MEIKKEIDNIVNFDNTPTLGESIAKSHIAATFTLPSKFQWSPKDLKYEDLTPKEQRYVLATKIQNWAERNEIAKYIREDFTLYFELHKNGNLHCHTTIKVHNQYDNEYCLLTMNKIYARMTKYANIYSSKFKFIFSLDK